MNLALTWWNNGIDDSPAFCLILHYFKKFLQTGKSAKLGLKNAREGGNFAELYNWNRKMHSARSFGESESFSSGLSFIQETSKYFLTKLIFYIVWLIRHRKTFLNSIRIYLNCVHWIKFADIFIGHPVSQSSKPQKRYFFLVARSQRGRGG